MSADNIPSASFRVQKAYIHAAGGAVAVRASSGGVGGGMYSPIDYLRAFAAERLYTSVHYTYIYVRENGATASSAQTLTLLTERDYTHTAIVCSRCCKLTFLPFFFILLRWVLWISFFLYLFLEKCEFLRVHIIIGGGLKFEVKNSDDEGLILLVLVNF